MSTQKKYRGTEILGKKFLFSVVACTAFTDDIDFDLTGIFKLILNLLDDISCNENHLIIRNNIGLDHDTDFTACLDSEGLFNTVE